MRASVCLLLLFVFAGCGAPSPCTGSPQAPSNAPLPGDPAARSPNVALGIPSDSTPADDIILDRGAFVASYNNARRVPNWVAWRLRREDLGSAERSNNFHPDNALARPVQPEDYEHSGFDRGHLCPSAHRTSSDASNGMTFLMSNMQPQLHGLNAGPWKAAESFERLLVLHSTRELYIVAGGIFDQGSALTRSGISIPKANFRITVILQRGLSARDTNVNTPVYALIMPNDATAQNRNWKDYQVSVDEVEALTGYDFLSEIPDDVENLLEARLGQIAAQ